MLSIREQENQIAREKHLEECATSNKEHLTEMECIRLRDEEYRLPKDLKFWQRRKQQVKILRKSKA
jgi:hypothetical protein